LWASEKALRLVKEREEMSVSALVKGKESALTKGKELALAKGLARQELRSQGLAQKAG
jgi:electron transfer flavoprotein alpha/beta subunit